MSPSPSSSDGKRRSSGMRPLKVLAAALAVAAVIKELRTPKEARTWHGALGGFVPYDFRMPTLEKVKATLWNPDAPIIANRAFGVGWTINAGAVVKKLRALADSR